MSIIACSGSFFLSLVRNNIETSSSVGAVHIL